MTTPTGVFTFGCPKIGDTTWARAYRLWVTGQGFPEGKGRGLIVAG